MVSDHSLLLGFAFGLFSALYFYIRMLSRVKHGLLTVWEARKLALAALSILNLPLIAITILASAFGLQQPMCMTGHGHFSGRTIAVLLNLAWWLGLLLWIWQDSMSGLVARTLLREPSQALERGSPVSPRLHGTQMFVRIVMGAIVAFVVGTGVRGLVTQQRPACSIILLPHWSAISESGDSSV